MYYIINAQGLKKSATRGFENQENVLGFRTKEKALEYIRENDLKDCTVELGKIKLNSIKPEFLFDLGFITFGADKNKKYSLVNYNDSADLLYAVYVIHAPHPDKLSEYQVTGKAFCGKQKIEIKPIYESESLQDFIALVEKISQL